MNKLVIPAVILAAACIPTASEAKLIKTNQPRLVVSEIDAEGNRDSFRLKIVNESKFDARQPFVRVSVIRDERIFRHERTLSPLEAGKSRGEIISCDKTRLRKGDLIMVFVGEQTKNKDGKKIEVGVTMRELRIVEEWLPVDRDFPKK
jgi:hypothetical protein